MLYIRGWTLLGGMLCLSAFAAAQTPSTQPVPTLHATSKLVVIDVVVTDSKQAPVHQLKASDFTLMEDGRQQTIKAFEEHSATTQPAAAPLPKLPPGKFTNYTVTPEDGTLNILVLDKLNTPLEQQADVKNQVLKYLKEAPAGTRMAIFALSTQLKMLQGFTSDPEVLRQLVAGKKGTPGASPLLNNLTVGGSGQDMTADNLSSLNSGGVYDTSSPDAATLITSLQQFETEQQTFQLMLRARYTLDGFNQLARYLSTLPGRKNLIWFSGSFPFNILPDGDQRDPFQSMASAEDEFRETISLLTRSQVAVYPIDAGELAVNIPNASSSGAGYAKNPTSADRKYYGAVDAAHNTMNQMAEDTGGKAFMNTNDLKTAIAKAIEAGSNYYTLAYAPTNSEEKGEYRKVEVKLDRSGVKLAYRRGYFTDQPLTARQRDAAAQDATSSTVATSGYNPVRAAMQHGAPSPQQLVFVADVRPANKDTEPAPASGNQPDPKTAGPYHRFTDTFVVNPKDLNCAVEADGDHHCDVEFLTFVYSADGALVNMAMNELKASYSGEHWAAFLKAPLAYRQQVSVPAKGEYWFRIGLYDETADRIGALELPVDVAARLPPAASSAPKPIAAPPTR